MKTKLAILIALASTGASFGVYALDGDVPPPSVKFPGSAPKLYRSEQGAFKAMEVATQLIESYIVQKGCQAASFSFGVHTIQDGSGTAALGRVGLKIALGGTNTSSGNWYTIKGQGKLGEMVITAIDSKGSFNSPSSIQELSTSWDAVSDVTTKPDHFNGTIIKDYWRLADLQPIPKGFDNAGTPVSTVIDYGYQQLTKNNYSKAKYWQQSRTWRDDGVNAGTHWVKTRVAPTGQTCIIEVKLKGYGASPTDNVEGFNERGSIKVIKDAVGPFSAK